MKKTTSLGMMGVAALAVLVAVSFLWITPAQPTGASDDSQPAPKLIWTLPDSDAVTPGTQVMPQPGSAQEVSFWFATTAGSEDIQSVMIRTHYPDGSVRGDIPAERVIGPSEIAAATVNAVNAGLMDQATADLIQTETSAVYRATSQLQSHEPAGHYRVEAWTTDGSGQALDQAANSFEYKELQACQLDFVTLDFGQVAPGERVRARGDQSIRNIGNVPFFVQVSATPMIGANTGQEIRNFSARFMGQQLDFIADEVATFSTALTPQSSARIEFAVVVPSQNPSDRYEGNMTVSASSVPAPQVTILEPQAGDVWQLGETGIITWQAAGEDLSIAIWFSPDGGQTWPVQIAENAANTGAYGWQIPEDSTLLTDQAVIRIIATDSIGSYGTALSGNITITEPDVAPTPTPTPIPTASPTSTPTSTPTGGGGGGGSGGGGGDAESTPTPTPTPSPTVPQVTVLAPGAGEVWYQAQTYSIQWQTSGNDLSITIWLSLDGGASWSTKIAGDISDTGTYAWAIPDDRSLTSENAIIKITATNPDGLSVSAQSGVFSCTPISH